MDTNTIITAIVAGILTALFIFTFQSILGFVIRNYKNHD